MGNSWLVGCFGFNGPLSSPGFKWRKNWQHSTQRITAISLFYQQGLSLGYTFCFVAKYENAA